MSEVYILIVDDLPNNLFALEKVLSALDVVVIKANSGEEALAHTLNYDFALAVLDVQMPDMNGYELADILLGDPTTSRIPIIFLTAAYADEQQAFHGYEKGAVDYIVKPLNPVIFLSKVNVFLELARYRISLEQIVTERTLALQEEGNRLRLLVENTPDCILNIDQNGTIIFINHSPSSLPYIGLSIYEFFGPKDRVQQQKALENVFATGEVTEFESYMQLPWNSQATWYSHRLAPIMQQPIMECVQISRDISDQKKANQARLQLIKAQAESKAKSHFLASMSHEIRTPMNAVLGYVQLLQRGGHLNAQQLDYLDIIDRSGEHLLLLIDSVLDMAKIEAGRMALTPSRISFYDLLNDIKRMFLLCAQKKGLTLTIQYPSDLPDWLIIDANKIRQILINLLGNALKFTEYGTIDLRAGLIANNDKQVTIFVEVEDTGCGIEAEKIKHIFDAFEQAKAGTQQIGAGLGLAVSLEFAKMMGGLIEVRSHVNKGSLFRFEFTAERSTFENRRGTHKIIKHLASNTVAPVILIIDDDLDNLNLLGDMLNSIGFTTHLIANSTEVLAAIAKLAPSLVIMDLKMEGFNGLTLTRKIRNSQSTKQLPIIMLTASPSQANRDLAFAAGVNQFFCKPVREQHLFNEIGQLLKLNYEFEQVSTSEPNDNRRLTPQQLSPLPSSLRSGLQEALRNGYINNINDCIAQIEAEDAELGQRLRLMANKFDYSSLLNLLDASGISDE